MHILTYGWAGPHDPRFLASGVARRYSGFRPIGFRPGLSGSSGSTPQPAPQVARCVPMFEGVRFTADIAVQDTRASASVVEQRFSEAHPCLAATVSAIRISSDPPEDNDESSRRYLESPHVCTTPDDGLHPRAEPNTRYAGLPVVLRATGGANSVQRHLGTVQDSRPWCSRLGWPQPVQRCRAALVVRGGEAFNGNAPSRY